MEVSKTTSLLSTIAQERRRSKDHSRASAKRVEPEPPAVPIFPFTSKLCAGLGAVTSLLALVALATSGKVVPVAHGENGLDFAPLAFHSRCAVLLIAQCALLEMCILICSYTSVGKPVRAEEDDELWSPKGWQPPRQSDLARRHLGDSVLSLVGYSLKAWTACHFMNVEGLIAHKSALAPQARSVFLGRHVQWALSVPPLVLLANRAFLCETCSQRMVILRSLSGLSLTTIYIMATWAMELTRSTALRNILMFLIACDYAAVAVDQVHLALSSRNVSSKKLKVAMLAYQIFAFGVYGMVYVLSYWNAFSFIREQTMYCYMDAMAKAFQGCFVAMIRNNEDFHIIQHWWMESVAARRDFARLLKQARIPIFTLDLQGRVTSWNAILARITGLPAEAVEAAEMHALLIKECRKPLSQALGRFASSPLGNHAAVEQLELIFQKNPFDPEPEVKDSEPLMGSRKSTAESSVVLVVSMVQKISKEGAVEGFIGIGQDISEIAELKAVEQRKSQLMSVVSHELRSPLHGMIGLTNMMEQCTADVGLKRQLGMVKCCACRLLDLVTNIMDLTEARERERRGLSAKARSMVNFVNVVEEVVMMTTTATDKAGKALVAPGVELVNLLPSLEKMPIILGNPHKCVQLMYNLVTNACKFTSKGSVTISAKHQKEASLLQIDVEDTGPGIAPEALERIFQPFEQDSSSTAGRSFEGMGLGLAVCKEVVALHKGSLTVRSKVGVGSTFTVTLPCEEQVVEVVAKPAKIETKPAAPKAAPKAPEAAKSAALEKAEEAARRGEEAAKAAAAELERVRQQLEEERARARAAQEEAQARLRRAEGLEKELERVKGEVEEAQRASTVVSEASQAAPALSASTGEGMEQLVRSSSKTMPWLYHQLQDRDREVVRLNARLAAQGSTQESVTRQLELVIQAACLTKGLLDAPSSL